MAFGPSTLSRKNLLRNSSEAVRGLSRLSPGVIDGILCMYGLEAIVWLSMMYLCSLADAAAVNTEVLTFDVHVLGIYLWFVMRAYAGRLVFCFRDQTFLQFPSSRVSHQCPDILATFDLHVIFQMVIIRTAIYIYYIYIMYLFFWEGRGLMNGTSK